MPESTKHDLAKTRLNFSDEVKKTHELKFHKAFSPKGTYGQPGFKPGRKAAVISTKHGLLTFEAMKIAAWQEVDAGTLTATQITEGEYAGQTQIDIVTSDDLDRVATRIRDYKTQVREQREAEQAEREASSPAALARQATDAITAALRSLDFHQQMNAPVDEKGRKRPGPQIDLTTFETELGTLREELSVARLSKDAEALKSIISRTAEAAGLMEKAVVEHLVASIDNRLGYHTDDLTGKFVTMIKANVAKIVEAYEKSGDAGTARRALVELNKAIGAEVRIKRGSAYAPRERSDEPRGGRRTSGGATLAERVASSQRGNRS